MTTAALFLILLLCLLTGMPIAFALGLSSITTILIFSNDSLASIALKLLEAQSEHYTLLAIPFFSLRMAFSDEGNYPEETTTRQAYDLLAAGFGLALLRRRR